MTPKQTPPPAKPSDELPPRPATFNLIPEKDYVLVLKGEELAPLRQALDEAGRGAGQDNGGEIPWAIRRKITAQMEHDAEIEAHAAGLIEGRKAQRAAAAKVDEIKKDAAESVAKAIGSRRKK